MRIAAGKRVGLALASIGAIACGLLGFFLGAGFIEWLKENWWGFWW